VVLWYLNKMISFSPFRVFVLPESTQSDFPPTTSVNHFFPSKIRDLHRWYPPDHECLPNYELPQLPLELTSPIPNNSTTPFEAFPHGRLRIFFPHVTPPPLHSVFCEPACPSCRPPPLFQNATPVFDSLAHITPRALVPFDVAASEPHGLWGRVEKPAPRVLLKDPRSPYWIFRGYSPPMLHVADQSFPPRSCVYLVLFSLTLSCLPHFLRLMNTLFPPFPLLGSFLC